jgi:hypothetical protein
MATEKGVVPKAIKMAEGQPLFLSAQPQILGEP